MCGWGTNHEIACIQTVLEDGWPESIFHDAQPESVHFYNYTFHCLLCACLYALHSVLALACALCMPLCSSLSTFPAHACRHFTLRLHCTVYFPCACLYTFPCLLSLCMPLFISLSTFPVHASMHFTLYLRYAFHCLPSLCIPLCISLCALPMHASMMPLCISRSILCVPLCISLSTFPAHASTHFSLYLPHACLYAFHCLLFLQMPLCISVSTFPVHSSMQFSLLFLCMPLFFTVYFPCACLYASHCLLSLRMPLCIALSTFPLHACMHFTLYLHSVLALCMPLCILLILLCTFSMHASMHFTVYFPSLQPELRGRTTCVLKSCDLANRNSHGTIGTSTTPIPAEGRAGMLKIAKTISCCTSTAPVPAEGCAHHSRIAKNPIDHADPRRRGTRGHVGNRNNHQFLHIDRAWSHCATLRYFFF